MLSPSRAAVPAQHSSSASGLSQHLRSMSSAATAVATQYAGKLFNPLVEAGGYKMNT